MEDFLKSTRTKILRNHRMDARCWRFSESISAKGKSRVRYISLEIITERNVMPGLEHQVKVMTVKQIDSNSTIIGREIAPHCGTTENKEREGARKF